MVFAHFTLDRVLLLMIEMFHSEDLLHVLWSCVHVLHHRFLSTLLLLLFDSLNELRMVQIVHKLLVLFLLRYALSNENFQFLHRLLLPLLLLLQFHGYRCCCIVGSFSSTDVLRWEVWLDLCLIEDWLLAFCKLLWVASDRVGTGGWMQCGTISEWVHLWRLIHPQNLHAWICPQVALDRVQIAALQSSIWYLGHCLQRFLTASPDLNRTIHFLSDPPHLFRSDSLDTTFRLDTNILRAFSLPWKVCNAVDLLPWLALHPTRWWLHAHRRWYSSVRWLEGVWWLIKDYRHRLVTCFRAIIDRGHVVCHVLRTTWLQCLHRRVLLIENVTELQSRLLSQTRAIWDANWTLLEVIVSHAWAQSCMTRVGLDLFL